MPRNSSGVYTLPQAAFTPGTVISSSAVNSDLSDMATALTQSLATTGVSTMTGQIKAVGGSASTPGYTFGGALTEGFYLAGTHQVGVATNGAVVGTFNSDQSITWTGNTTFTGTSIHTGNVTFNATTYTFGAGAVTGFLAGLALKSAIEFTIDGLGAAISTGQKGHLEVPFNCTIQRNTMLADQSGSIVVNVWKTSFAGFPPNSGNKITNVTPPTLTAAQSSQDSTLSGWTTTLTAGDILAFNVDSATTITRVTLSLFVLRTGA